MKTPEERKRKLLLFLPLLVIPFLALGFYALKGKDDRDGKQQASQGLNTSLPGANLKGQKTADKMALEDQASKDSASARSAGNSNAFAALGWDTSKISKTNGLTANANTAQASEAKISQKLAEITRQVNAPPPVSHYPQSYAGAGAENPDMDKLEKLLKQRSRAGAPDPQMQQLNTMLDKIMQIQNPGLAKEKQLAPPATTDSAFKAIPAIIDGNQKVMNGGVVRLRLQDTIKLNGMMIPKGQSLSGSCTVTNQRLLLDIKNIRLGTSILPVNLTVFSMDGMQGINAPEAELGEAAGNGVNGALENMEFLSMDQSLTTQAATAGISAAKGLLGKKVKKIRVKLRGGLPVLIRINHN